MPISAEKFPEVFVGLGRPDLKYQDADQVAMRLQQGAMQKFVAFAVTKAMEENPQNAENRDPGSFMVLVGDFRRHDRAAKQFDSEVIRGICDSAIFWGGGFVDPVMISSYNSTTCAESYGYDHPRDADKETQVDLAGKFPQAARQSESGLDFTDLEEGFLTMLQKKVRVEAMNLTGLNLFVRDQRLVEYDNEGNQTGAIEFPGMKLRFPPEQTLQGVRVGTQENVPYQASRGPKETLWSVMRDGSDRVLFTLQPYNLPNF